MGQCGSESPGFAPYSGTGRQTDFVRAANRSSGGNSVGQRCEALIGIAHPNFRAELREAAKKMKLL
jgi:acyl-CoA hydrolase